MRSFWTYITNGNYSLGLTGRTIYVYDKDGNELKNFSHLPYAYTAAFSPKNDIFVVKTTDGRLAVYSLEKMSIIKKFRFSKIDASQDDNFCFSPDGEQFFNIERHGDTYKTALSVYSTRDFSLKKRLFEDDDKTELTAIEYDSESETYFFSGFLRNTDAVAERFFVAKFIDDKLSEMKFISEKLYRFYHEYSVLKMHGFTKKAKEWSGLDKNELNAIENKDYSLARLWQKQDL